MKKLLLFYCAALSVLSLVLFTGFIAPVAQQTRQLEGAWRLNGSPANGNITTIQLVQDGFFSVAVFDQENKKFIGTYGGTIQTNNGKLTKTYEFSTFDKKQVGTTKTETYSLKNGKWYTSGLGQTSNAENWERIDESSVDSPLSGTWRITAREQNGQMNTMKPGPRKTLKVLSDTRFQWIAFNTETGEFSGTGGGTYTATNGKYTENIEFFSRDSSRVGMSLGFNFAVKDGKWHHTGQSSTGKPVNEIWQRISED